VVSAFHPGDFERPPLVSTLCPKLQLPNSWLAGGVPYGNALAKSTERLGTKSDLRR